MDMHSKNDSIIPLNLYHNAYHLRHGQHQGRWRCGTAGTPPHRWGGTQSRTITLGESFAVFSRAK